MTMDNHTMPSGAVPPDSGNVASRPELIASNDPATTESRPAAIAVTVGALLRENREKLGLSQGDIASKLRMGVKQVAALENADYASLPVGTFLRGFVRNYARAVALNADEVLGLLERTHTGAAPIKASPVVVPKQQNIKVPAPGSELISARSRLMAAAVVLLALCAAGWYWWEFVRPTRSEAGKPAVTASATIALPAPRDTQATTTDAQAPAQTASVAPDREPVAQAAPVAKSPNPALPAAPAVSPGAAQSPVPASLRAVQPIPAGSGLLGFTFSGESWVEVVDASGKTLVYRRFKAGETEEVTGRTPFSILVGNAAVTRMAYNGKEFALDAHTRGAVARVTIK